MAGRFFSAVDSRIEISSKVFSERFDKVIKGLEGGKEKAKEDVLRTRSSLTENSHPPLRGTSNRPEGREKNQKGETP
jgi:hypothetical protein